VPSLKVVAKHGEAAIRDAVATVGFTPAEELQHPFEGHTELYFRSALPEAYFGRGGLSVSATDRTSTPAPPLGAAASVMCSGWNCPCRAGSGGLSRSSQHPY